jgi:hypothetical protein
MQVYTHRISWVENHKQHGTINKQFNTTWNAVKIHEQILSKNTEVLSWETTRIKYNKLTKKYEDAI